jgi:predicted phosphate transport protein (TIGR00153 family)
MNNSFFSRFTPKEPKFFPLFKDLSCVLTTASDLLVDCMKTNNHEQQVEYYKKIKDQERLGDKLSHQVFDELNSTFITPFDREDLHDLAMHLDDVMDGINSSAKRIALYKPRNIPEDALELSLLIRDASICIGKIMEELDALKHKSSGIKTRCKELHEIENRADDVYELFVIKLFENEKDSIELFKLKEILYEMEKTTDIAEHVGKIVRTIIIKYA